MAPHGRRGLALCIVWLSLLAQAPALYWVRSHEGQSCSEACPKGCLEDLRYYPNTSADFEEVMRQAGVECASIVEGGMRYDPSVDTGRTCGFSQWRAMPMSFCDLRAPPMAFRFCPCGGDEGQRGAAPFDCLDAGAASGAGGCMTKAEWCCHYREMGCKTTALPILYDCAEAYTNWLYGWSQSKKDWCCQRQGIACARISNGTILGSFDVRVRHPDRFVSDPGVDAELGGRIAAAGGVGASAVRLMRNRLADVAEPRSDSRDSAGAAGSRRLADGTGLVRVGFMITTPQGGRVSVPDVVAALREVSAYEWTRSFRAALSSDELSIYEIKVEQMGTVMANGVKADAGYLCNEGLSNWQVGWPEAKKTWCCRRQGLGCSAEMLQTEAPGNFVARYPRGWLIFESITLLVLVGVCCWCSYSRRPSRKTSVGPSEPGHACPA